MIAAVALCTTPGCGMLGLAYAGRDDLIAQPPRITIALVGQPESRWSKAERPPTPRPSRQPVERDDEPDDDEPIASRAEPPRRALARQPATQALVAEGADPDLAEDDPALAEAALDAGVRHWRSKHANRPKNIAYEDTIKRDGRTTHVEGMTVR